MNKKNNDLPMGDVPINFASAEFIKNPYPYLKKLRATSPIYYDPFLNRWFVMTYDHAVEQLRNPAHCHDLRKADEGTASHRFITTIGDEYLSPLFQDPPVHKQLRSAISSRFSKAHVDLLKPKIEQYAYKLLENIDDINNFDVVNFYVYPLTIKIITDIIGLDFEDWKEYMDIVRTNNQTFDLNINQEEKDRLSSSKKILENMLSNTISSRRSIPCDDLITDMLSSDAIFDERTIIVTCKFILRAGNLTTSDLISNTIWSLLQNNEVLKSTIQHPENISQIIEEVLRYDTSALEAGRITTKDIDIEGTIIPAGQTLMISLASANHDTSRFENPDIFNPFRRYKTHVSFGAGPHFCIGAYLARVEAEIAIRVLLGVLPSMKLHPFKQSIRHMLSSFRGFNSLFICQ